MKRWVWLAFALSLLMVPNAGAQVSTYTALLTGANETPNPADPDAVGFAVITLDQGTGTITFTAFAQNIATPTASHIHRGAAGVTGPVIIPFNLPFSGGVSSGTLTGIAASFMAEVVANPPGYYFNVATVMLAVAAARLRLEPGRGHGHDSGLEPRAVPGLLPDQYGRRLRSEAGGLLHDLRRRRRDGRHRVRRSALRLHGGGRQLYGRQLLLARGSAGPDRRT